MACGSRSDLSGDTAESFLYQLFERPARAVTGKHAEVVDMYIRVSVRVCYLVVVNFAQPVIGGYRAAVGEYQTADRIGDGGILLYAPVGSFYVAVNERLVVEHGRLHVADLFSLTSVENVSFRNVGVACLNKHGLNAVLNVLDRYLTVLDLGLEICGDFEREHIDHAGVILLFLCFESFRNGDRYLFYIEFCDSSVSLNDLIHNYSFSFCGSFRVQESLYHRNSAVSIYCGNIF